MRAVKITKNNYMIAGDQGLDAAPVRVKFYNDLLDDLNDAIILYNANIVGIEADIAALEVAVGTGAMGTGPTPVVRTNNPIVATASANENIDNLDAAIGANVSPMIRTVGPVATANTVNQNIDALDLAIGPNLTPLTRTTGQLVTSTGVNGNIDLLDTVIGFDAQISGTPNIISRAYTIYQNIDALDARMQSVKAITSTTGGTAGGQMIGVEHHLLITSVTGTKVISLPLLSAFRTGGQIVGVLVNTGCQVKPHPTDRTLTKKINNATGGNMLQLSSGTGAYFEAVKLDINRWIVKGWSNTGINTTLVPALT